MNARTFGQSSERKTKPRKQPKQPQTPSAKKSAQKPPCETAASMKKQPRHLAMVTQTWQANTAGKSANKNGGVNAFFMPLKAP